MHEATEKINTQELLNAALEYARLGYPVFPCHPGGKTPLTAHGFKDASTDPDQIERWWNTWPYANVAIATAGLVAIDIDPMDDGEDNPWPGEPLAADLMTAGAISTTPRGGSHFVFRQPEGKAWRNTAGKTGLAESVDTRANGGYIVAAPSVVGGKAYQWIDGYELDRERGALPEPPGWLIEALDLLAKKPGKPAPVDAVEQPEPSVGGGGGDGNWREPIERDYESRTTWAEILQPHGWVFVGTGPDGLDRWRRPGKEDGHSATAGVRFSGNDVLHVFSGNALPFRANRTYGKFRAYSILHHAGNMVEAASALRSEGFGLPDPAQSVDLGGFRVGGQGADGVIGGGHGNGPTDPGPFPEHLLQVPGFIGEMVRYTLETAHRPQPVLTLAAGIALMGTLAGRKVLDRTGTRPNIYTLALGPSGCGKDKPRGVCKAILDAAGWTALIGPESLASAAGLERAVSDAPSCIGLLDEFGKVLAAIKAADRSPHLSQIPTLLLRLFTESGGVWKGASHADAAFDHVVNQPNFCLFGTTTSEVFLNSLSHESLTDGLLGRMLIFEAPAKIPKMSRPTVQQIPERLTNMAVAWRGFRGDAGNLATGNPDPAVIPTTDKAENVLHQFSEACDNTINRLGQQYGGLWTRTAEKACKLALLYACSKAEHQPGEAEIDLDAAVWGVALSDYLTRRMSFLAADWIADGRYDALRLRILRTIRAAGPEGLTLRDLVRKTQSIEAVDRTKVITALNEAGEIASITVKQKTGRPKVVYVTAEHATKMADE